MKQRINPFVKGQNAMKSMFGLGAYLEQSVIDQQLLTLLYFRVSQINGCAFCLDMHSKDLRLNGETEQRLFVLDAWRETPFYSDRERAALAWAEAVTRISNGDVKDEVYEVVRKEFSEEEIIDLTLAIVTINSYNRINIAFRTQAGNYKPKLHASHAN